MRGRWARLHPNHPEEQDDQFCEHVTGPEPRIRIHERATETAEESVAPMAEMAIILSYRQNSALPCPNIRCDNRRSVPARPGHVERRAVDLRQRFRNQRWAVPDRLEQHEPERFCASTMSNMRIEPPA